MSQVSRESRLSQRSQVSQTSQTSETPEISETLETTETHPETTETHSETPEMTETPETSETSSSILDPWDKKRFIGHVWSAEQWVHVNCNHYVTEWHDITNVTWWCQLVKKTVERRMQEVREHWVDFFMWEHASGWDYKSYSLRHFTQHADKSLCFTSTGYPPKVAAVSSIRD